MATRPQPRRLDWQGPVKSLEEANQRLSRLWTSADEMFEILFKGLSSTDATAAAASTRTLLTGPVGIPGLDGFDGEDGPQGQIGPQGYVGAVGSTGLQGPPGPDGDTGDDGAFIITNPPSVDLANQTQGVLPVGRGGTGTSTAFTAGSVVFAGISGVYSQDNANFFWDATNHRLALGTTNPIEVVADAVFHVHAAATAAISVYAATAVDKALFSTWSDSGGAKTRQNYISTDGNAYFRGCLGVGVGDQRSVSQVAIQRGGAQANALIIDSTNPTEVIASTPQVYIRSTDASANPPLVIYAASSAGGTMVGVYSDAGGVKTRQYFLSNTGTGYFRQGLGIGVTGPTALVHLAAGTATASTAPLKFNSGVSLTTAEAGAVEFTTDDYYATITTGAARKGIILNDGVNLTSGKIPVATTNGRLKDSTAALLITGGVPTIVASTFEKAETGTDANVLTYATGGSDEFLAVCVSTDVSALTGTSVVVTLTWKDSNNSTQTNNVTLSGVGDGTINIPINAKASNNVVVSTVFTGVSTAYNVSAIITRLK